MTEHVLGVSVAAANGAQILAPANGVRVTDVARADECLRRLSHVAQLHLGELVDAAMAEITAQMPVYGQGVLVASEDLRTSVRENQIKMIAALSDIDAVDLERARETGSRRARQGVPLPEVLRAFRIGFSALWQLLLDLSSSTGEPELQTLTAAANRFWYLIDVYLEAVTDGYRDLTNELVRAQRQRRGALLEALLSGSVITDNALWDVTQLLGVPHDGTFAVVAAETGEFASAALPGVERLLEERGIASAWRLTPSYELGIVSLGQASRLGDLTAELTRLARTRIGVSPVFRGLENTPRALHLAHVARSSIPSGESTAVCFDDSPLSMLVAAAPVESLSVAHTLLRPILDMPSAERDSLLDTVDIWIANGGSTKASASQLFCHPNTVRYRLHRVQGELEMSLTDPTELAQLVVALRAWRLFGNLKPRSNRI